MDAEKRQGSELDPECGVRFEKHDLILLDELKKKKSLNVIQFNHTDLMYVPELRKFIEVFFPPQCTV